MSAVLARSRARAVCVRRAGVWTACLVALLIPRASRAGDRELHAPYLRFDAEAPATLRITDDGDRGALVRVQLVDPEGRLVSYGEHPITISRAVPPGETIEIDLSSFRDDGHEGSLTLTASRPVNARVDLAGGAYALVPPREGRILLPIPGSAPRQLSLALVVCGESPLDTMLRRRRGDDLSDSERLRIPAGGSRLVSLDDVRSGDVLVLETGTAVALLLLRGRDGRAVKGLSPR